MESGGYYAEDSEIFPAAGVNALQGLGQGDSHIAALLIPVEQKNRSRGKPRKGRNKIAHDGDVILYWGKKLHKASEKRKDSDDQPQSLVPQKRNRRGSHSAWILPAVLITGGGSIALSRGLLMPGEDKNKSHGKVQQN